MPLSLYICETLLSLELYKVVLANVELVSLPCLKIILLKEIVYPNETTFEKFVSSRPILEELKIFVAIYDAKFYPVHSRSLKMLFLIQTFTY